MLSSACALALSLALTASQPSAVVSAPSPDRPFHHLLLNLGADLRALPTAEGALFLSAGTIGALAIHPADDNLAAWARSRGTAGYTRLGDVFGNGWVQAGAAVATYAVGAAGGHREVTHLGSDLIRAQLLNGMATRGLKITANRRRPSGGGHSFPSGHSSAAFVSAAVLDAHYGWRVGLPAYAAAGFIGWTRVRDDAHWLSDVIVGGTVGTIVGRAVAGRHVRRGWTVVPTASAAGAAVLITKDPSRQTRRESADRRRPPATPPAQTTE